MCLNWIITFGDKDKDALIDYTLNPNRKHGGVIYNSLDISKIKFSAKGGKFLTWLGKIVPYKGILEVIKVAKMAKKQLVFAGIVDKLNSISVNYFEKKIKPLIDGKQIIYLGPADLKLKNKLLGNAEAFINPIKWDEPFGMVMIEAMACGTPVISFKRGSAPEVINDKKQTGNG